MVIYRSQYCLRMSLRCLFGLCVACPQLLTVKLLYSNVAQAETNMNCSDNSTDSSEGSPTGTVMGPKMASPNSEQERLLPSCVSQFKNLYI